MTLLLTGAAGFIGSHTTKKLLSLGHTVVGVDSIDSYYSRTLKRYNLSHLCESSAFSFHQGSICDSDFIHDLFTRVCPDAVIHLAARAGVRASIEEPSAYTYTNVWGTQVILEAARAAQVRKVMIASSSSVYGLNSKVPFAETDPVDNQISPYAATKRATEVLCKTYADTYALPIQMFRFFTVYGPSGRPDMAPIIFTRAIDAGRPITVHGSTDTERDYTFVDDITHGLVCALEVEDRFEIYNLGNNTPHKLRELIDTISHHLGKKAKIKIGPSRAGDVERTWADIQKAHDRLGYTPKFTLEKGIERMIEWYSKHKELYEE